MHGLLVDFYKYNVFQLATMFNKFMVLQQFVWSHRQRHHHPFQ